MNQFRLTSDSTVDLTAEILQDRDILYVPFTYELNERIYQDDLGQTVSYEEYYQKIREGAMPTTSQVSPLRYREFFEPFLKAGEDVLHLCFSSGLSGSAGSAILAAKELSEVYPDQSIRVIDSLAASSGMGLLLMQLADLRDEGMSLEEVYHWAIEHRLEVRHWVMSTNLEHYKRGGRISALAATAGSMLKLCPIIDMNPEGKLIPRRKARGQRRAMEDLLQAMTEQAQAGLNYSGRVYICHSDFLEDAKEMASLIKDRFPQAQEPMIFPIGYVIGAHTGPGTLAIFYWGSKRTD